MGEYVNADNLVFGLDIGTRSIVGTVGYRKPSGQFVILAQKTKCHETRAMLDGQIHDIVKVAENVSYIKEQLEKELPVRLENVCVAAAGRVLKTVTVRMDYDLGDEMTITRDMIFAMELRGMEQANAKLRSLEKDGTGYYCVGYSIVKYYLGNTQLTNLEGHRGSKIGADVLATFLPRDVIDGLNAVCERSGLKISNLTLEPIAAMNIAIPEKFRLLNLALVDVGAGTSDICITKDGSITGYGMLPCAGDFLTESIMHALLTDFNTAETVKLAYSQKKKKIPYTDVMGMKMTVGTAQISKILEEPFKKLTAMIAEKILELNGNEPVGAIFIVGGGGKNPAFAEELSKATGLMRQRVALRGEEVFTDIITPDGEPVSDPMLVTPIGICLNYYEQNNNFVMIRLNGNDVKLYNNGKLNVMDAAVGVGITNDDIFPKRGKNLVFTVNGSERVVKGRNGDSSIITVNGEPAGIATPIRSHDNVEIVLSTEGAEGKMKISELPEVKTGLEFIINGKATRLPKCALLNGKAADPSTDISDRDEITVPDYCSFGDLCQHLGVNPDFELVINNEKIDLETYSPDEKIYEHFIIDIMPKSRGSLTEMIKDASAVVGAADDSDGETVLDDEAGSDNESYEEYLDRRYGKNQYRSVKHDETEAYEEGREGYGSFGKMSGLEIASMLGNSSGDFTSAGMSDGKDSNEELLERLRAQLANLNAKQEKQLRQVKSVENAADAGVKTEAKPDAGKTALKPDAGKTVLKPDAGKTEVKPAAPTGAVQSSGSEITCYVNGTPVKMNGKPGYIFVDILDHYSFDTSTPHGEAVIMQVNGLKADFFTPVYNGDVVDLYWK